MAPRVREAHLGRRRISAPWVTLLKVVRDRRILISTSQSQIWKVRKGKTPAGSCEPSGDISIFQMKKKFPRGRVYLATLCYGAIPKWHPHYLGRGIRTLWGRLLEFYSAFQHQMWTRDGAGPEMHKNCGCNLCIAFMGKRSVMSRCYIKSGRESWRSAGCWPRNTCHPHGKPSARSHSLLHNLYKDMSKKLGCMIVPEAAGMQAHTT